MGLLTALLLPAAAALAAPEPPGSDLFRTKIQPLLQQRCLGCHGVGKQFARLDMRSRETLLRGGGRGPAVIPGRPEKSLLFRMAAGELSPRMPPQNPLTPAEIADLGAWIRAGAPWSGESIAGAARQTWWSFKPPVRHAVPRPRDGGWIRTPVDAFILQGLQRAQLAPSPRAGRRELIRRAYLDVIGLPPSPEEVAAFEADRQPGAWMRVVDRLLASPHFGERWARHWLDLVRFAESAGFEGDKDRPNAWRYRDYVIRAFNEDRPYDQFLMEQLAGDELDPQNHRNIVATGYLALGVEDFAMAKLPQTRADELDDLVSTTGAAMLGLTLGCARCHDHKYDPVSQVDYYRLYALFAPSRRKEWEIPTAEERAEIDLHNQGVERDLQPLRQELAELKPRGEPAGPGADEAALRAALSGDDRKRWDELKAALAEGEKRRRAYPAAMAVTDEGPAHPKVHLLIRGNASTPGPEVQPGFITALPGGNRPVSAAPAAGRTTGRRLALARWITDPGNPLTARVWVNRIWQHYFGRGIVATPSNFGFNGAPPAHPELLDWLASSLVTGNWSASAGGAPGEAWRFRPLHRMILLSSTYQQASALRREAYRRDPDNLRLWRMPVRRLDAEVIRDSILAVAGTLDLKAGGPPVYPPVDPSLRADGFQGYNWPEVKDGPESWRRSIYVKVKRSLIFPLLEVFDCPEITASVAARNVSVTPNQALTMLNSPLILRQADEFAARVRREAGEQPEKQVDRAFRLALGRPPSPAERRVSREYLRRAPGERDRLADFCHSLLNLSEFVYVE